MHFLKISDKMISLLLLLRIGIGQIHFLTYIHIRNLYNFSNFELEPKIQQAELCLAYVTLYRTAQIQPSNIPLKNSTYPCSEKSLVLKS